MKPHYHKETPILLLEGSLRAIPFNGLIALLLALDLFYNKTPSFLVFFWLSTITIISIIRWVFCHNTLRLKHYQTQRRTHLAGFTWLTLLMGVAWGACYWLMLPYIGELHQFIIILVLGGMCAGSIASLSVHLPAYYAYILPMFLPIILYNYYVSDLDHIILATMFSLFVLMLLISAKMNNHLLNKTFQLAREKESLIKKLRILSTTDALTGLYNRRHFESSLQKERYRAKRNNYSLVLILLDVDNFKYLNDRFGHLCGDRVLIKTAQILQKIFRRAEDMIFRLGGDEFSVILANQTLDKAQELCAILTKTMTAENILTQDKTPIHLTLSIGILLVQSDYTFSNKELIDAVDKALYQAKKSGKNQVVITQLNQ
ncbi:TPA: diguanylate cyclase [Legionella pneumophila]|uniref:GGDEF domain-containing protein n=1 Tax=Legionella pneumophila TaxID=446 RepID=UPI000776F770|nr:GGDEF domain-containing protein [Legionella pneumophila]